MSDLDDFLAEVLPRQLAAVEAFHNGDPGPQLAMSSAQDPVTVFGASGVSKSGWDEVSQTFHWLASRFSDCTVQSFDLLAAGVSGDLAYTVGFEHAAHSRDDVPEGPYTLRVTHSYRREDGEWKIVHRQGDRPQSITAFPPGRPRARHSSRIVSPSEQVALTEGWAPPRASGWAPMRKQSAPPSTYTSACHEVGGEAALRRLIGRAAMVGSARLSLAPGTVPSWMLVSRRSGGSGVHR